MLGTFATRPAAPAEETTMAQLTPIVQQIYADFATGNIAAVVATFHDDIRFVHPGGPDIPYAKDRRGKAEAAAFFSDYVACVEVTAFEPQRYVEQGNSVVAFGRLGGRALATGKTFEVDWAMLWTFDGTKVSHYQEFDDTHTVAKALRA
jgi:uncharacterized protein